MSKQDKNASFIDALLKASERGDIEIVREARLKGPLGSLENTESSYVALYPKTAEARDWLLAQKDSISISGRVEPAFGFEGKYYLHNGAEKAFIERGIACANDGFGPNRPHAMPKYPSDGKAVLVRISPEEDVGGHTHALVFAVPYDPNKSLVNQLRTDGFLPNNEGDGFLHAFYMNRKTGTALYAVPIAEPLAESLLANPYNTIENWLDSPPVDTSQCALEQVVTALAPHLRHVPRQVQEPVQAVKVEKEPEPKKILPSLHSQRERLRELGLRVVHQMQPNGGKQSWLVHDKKQSLKYFVNAARIEDPLKLGAEESFIKDDVRRLIGKEELQRLEVLLGYALPEMEPLPLNERQIQNIFKPRRYPQSTEMIKVGHVAFARLLPAGDGTTLEYYMYIAADQKMRVQAVIDKLQISPRQYITLSEEKERPVLMRISLEEAAWSALKNEAARAHAAGHTAFLQLEDGRSEQAFNSEMRELCGVKVDREAIKKEAEAPRKEPLKNSGDASIALVAELIGGYSILHGSVDRVSRDSWGKVKARVTSPSLFVRGSINELRHIEKVLKKQTEDFADLNTVSLVVGHKKMNNKEKGVLEIRCSDAQLVRILTALPESATMHKHDSALASDSYKTVIEHYFKGQEQVSSERNATKEAWKHLAELSLIPVRVSAPNKHKLAVVATQMEQLREFLSGFASPLGVLDGIEIRFGGVMKSLRKEGEPDNVILQEIKSARDAVKSSLQQVQEGFPTRIQKRLDYLESERKRIEDAGVRTHFVILNPDNRSLRVLAPLVEQRVLRMDELGNSGTIQLLPDDKQQIIDHMKSVGVAVHDANAAVIAADALVDWAAQKRSDFLARREKPTTVIVGKAAARREDPAGAQTDVGSGGVQDPVGRNVMKAIVGSAQHLKGVFAWERQEPQFSNYATEDSIGVQPVLALVAHTHDEVQYIKKLYNAMLDAGLLMEQPRFYGEVIPENARQNSGTVQPEETGGKRELLEAEKSRLENVRSAISGIKYHYERREDVFHADAYETGSAELIKAFDAQEIPAMQEQKWRKAVFEFTSGTRGIEALDEVLKLIGIRMRALSDELYDVASVTQKRRTGLTDAPITSVISGEAKLYPVDGRAGSARDELQLDTWRQVLKRPHENGAGSPGVLGLKLYINPERLAEAEALLTQSQIEIKLNHTLERPLSAEQVANRIYGLYSNRVDDQNKDVLR